MQGTIVLGTGEPSPIMKRSPSMRLMKAGENMSGDKLFSSFDLASLSTRTRRNSISSLGSGGVSRTERSRGSVPVVVFGLHSNINSQRLGVRPGSITNSKYRSLKSYLRASLGEQTGNSANGGNELSKLDDMLAKIKNQLDDMSAETRNVGRRVSMLSQDITVLSNKAPNSQQTQGKHLTMPDCRRNDMDSTTVPSRMQYNTLPLVLPIERTHSQPPPPLLQINDIWADTEYCQNGSGEDSGDNHVSQGSEEDFEVQVIKSSKFDSHHMIMLSSLIDQRLSDDNLSDHYESDDPNEDVFDNSPQT